MTERGGEPAPTRVVEMTARGSGGISVLRLVGPRARAIARAVAPRARLRAGRPELAAIESRGERLDEALVLMPSARDPDLECVELHLHGSPAVVADVRAALAAAGALGAPSAEPCLEQRARARLAGVRSVEGARLLLDQAEGALRAACERLCLADPVRCAVQLDRLLEAARVHRPSLTPPRVALAGGVNAGKSTLFNALVGRERATTSDEAGTTRDAVVEAVLVRGFELELVDVAGERELPGDGDAQAGVERHGQRLARELQETADLVLRCVPSDSRVETVAAAPREVRVVTFADRLGSGERGRRSDAVDALHEPHAARERVEDLLAGALELDAARWRPGEAVPFEPAFAALAASVRGVTSTPERWRVTSAWLGPRDGAPWP